MCAWETEERRRERKGMMMAIIALSNFFLICVLYVLVNVLLRVYYRNYCTRGVAEVLRQHEAKPSAVLASRPLLECNSI